jgi:hypothetical protein
MELEWKDMHEELPPEPGSYIVFLGENVAMANYDLNSRWEDPCFHHFHENVTHWMPFPYSPLHCEKWKDFPIDLPQNPGIYIIFLDWRDFALMSELRGNIGDNKLYFAVEKEGEKQKLFYKVKGFDEKFEISAADANNDDAFISRLIITISEDKLNSIDFEDRRKLLRITLKRGRTILYGKATLATYVNSMWLESCFQKEGYGNVTHWMPIPEPPLS